MKAVVQKEFPEKGEISIHRTESDDNRSYHINSDKIKKVLGFSLKDQLKLQLRIYARLLKRIKLLIPLITTFTSM